jgi:FkbM family methyltransferase
MALLIIRIYRFLFARKCFYLFNKVLYRLSLSGLGVLNFESDKASGEEYFLKKHFKYVAGGVVLDVGANVGKYSELVQHYNPSANIYAFEPHPKTYKKLCEIMRSNSFHAVNAAVGEAQGMLSLYDYEEKDGSSHASLFKDVIEGIHNAESIAHQVEVMRLDDFIERNGFQSISLLKIDTEGNELNVLKGALENIKAGKIKAIHFEFNEMNVASRTYFRDFWNLLSNYDFFRLLPSGMIQIDKYSAVQTEIFAYQNIVAILKVK